MRFFLIILLGLLFPVTALAGTGKILFDQGHDQRFLIEQEKELDLSSLASLLREGGKTVESTVQPLTPAVLADVSALVISGPFRTLTPAEVTAVTDFVKHGGRLAVMLHIAPPVAPLLHRLGILPSKSVVREEENLLDAGNKQDFLVRNLKKCSLFAGITQFRVNGSWALKANRDGVESMAETSSGAWMDLNGSNEYDKGDAKQAFSIVLSGTEGSGRFVVFGDDAVFQNKYLKEENLLLGRNLAKWLTE